jgi:hypothetical protein
MENMNVIVAKYESRDPRDAGAGPSTDLYQVGDKEMGTALCAYLNCLSILADLVYLDYGNGKTFKTRDESYQAASTYEEKIRRWFPAYSVAYNYRFRVDVRPIPAMVDLTPFKEEMAL